MNSSMRCEFVGGVGVEVVCGPPTYLLIDLSERARVSGFWSFYLIVWHPSGGSRERGIHKKRGKGKGG